MAKEETIKVPDLGGAEEVAVIEIAVKAGDTVAAEDTLVVLESDKASLDMPAPVAGVVKKVLVKVGDNVSEGSDVVVIELSEEDSGDHQKGPEKEKADKEDAEPAPAEEKKTAAGSDKGEGEGEDKGKDKAKDRQPSSDKAAAKGGDSEQRTVTLPDLGTDEAVEVIELSVAAGDQVGEGDTLLVLEGDKATMDVPSPWAGTLDKLLVKEGDKVSSGDAVGEMTVESVPASDQPAAKKPAPETEESPPSSEGRAQEKGEEKPEGAPPKEDKAAGGGRSPETLSESEAPASEVYAGPMVRQFARELGVDLRNVEGKGNKGRIRKEDVEGYIKRALQSLESGAVGTGGGALPGIPDVDFSQFGEVEEVALNKVGRLTAANMSRNWLNAPMVTQFDDADITELETFRKSLRDEAESRGVKLTPVAFLMMACARALAANPVINRSWHSSGDKVIQKHYCHIGMAVDTPRGLLVPVVRDVDKKSLWQLAEEIGELGAKARDGKLSGADMQGGCFSISSLGAMGGRGFTPIVNAPEAAILGVSKASIQPVWDGTDFVPRQLLPLSLTYDHRVVNGADGGRFLTHLVALLGDIRRLLL